MKLRLARKVGKAVGTRCLTQDMRSICPHKGSTHRRSIKRLARSIARARRPRQYKSVRAVKRFFVADRDKLPAPCGYVDKSVDNS